MKKLKMLVASGAFLGVLFVIASPSHAITQPASWGASGSTMTAVADRAVPKDGSGLPFDTQVSLGWKVYEASGTTNYSLLRDELGRAPTSGLVHAVCVDPDPDLGFTVLFDTNTTAVGALSTESGFSLTGKVKALATAQVCAVLDVQFNRGVGIKNSNNNGVHILWRPSKGGSN